MEFPKQFISATREFCTYESHVAAPYLRKKFNIVKKVESAEIIICGLGFYELFINSKKITKGILAPYISNPDHFYYYDRYDVTGKLTCGDNVIGIMLGNGMQNAFGGSVWNFDNASFRSAPKLSLSLKVRYTDGEIYEITADESFKTHPSPVYFDDLRYGEYYDARLEIENWCSAKFDDSKWGNAFITQPPAGEARICYAEPIVLSKKLYPKSIVKQENGYLYDFGENCAGVCELKINGKQGQEITLIHGERLENGKLDLKNIQFQDKEYIQKVIYICKGNEDEKHTPCFTYHGFRYVFVQGILENQANKDLLTYLVMNSALEERGGFTCSDEMANTLQTITRRSTLSNFYYFPTDCPHREKNGWTGDASVSTEHMLLNVGVEKSYRQWMENIRKAQSEEGAIPGIIPTTDWGYDKYNGPAFDSVIINIPYYTYIYRNDVNILKENVVLIFRYLHYLTTKLNNRGLLAFGLGDWSQTDREQAEYIAPQEVTDSILSMDMCKKAAFIFNILNMKLQKDFALELYDLLRKNIRNHLIDFPSMTMNGNCQTSQSMGIFYNVFEEGEKQEAFQVLLNQIKLKNNHMDVGILGARVIFHVLSDFGHAELAFYMITSTEFPSYGNWVARGATSLWEDFRKEGEKINSQNHHMFGDISAWFIKHLAGINVNPHGYDISEVDIRPNFIEKLSFVKGFHIMPQGKVEVIWEKEEKVIVLKIIIPNDVTCKVQLPHGYRFENGKEVQSLKSGVWTVFQESNKDSLKYIL